MSLSSLKSGGCDIHHLEEIVKMIAAGDKTEELKRLYDDHELHGNWKAHRELHIEPDWLLIYRLMISLFYLSSGQEHTATYLTNKILPKHSTRLRQAQCRRRVCLYLINKPRKP